LSTLKRERERDKTRYVGKKKKRMKFLNKVIECLFSILTWYLAHRFDILNVMFSSRKSSFVGLEKQEKGGTGKIQFYSFCCLLTDWKVPFYFIIHRVKIKHQMMTHTYTEKKIGCIDLEKKLITLKWEILVLTAISIYTCADRWGGFLFLFRMRQWSARWVNW